MAALSYFVAFRYPSSSPFPKLGSSYSCSLPSLPCGNPHQNPNPDCSRLCASAGGRQPRGRGRGSGSGSGSGRRVKSNADLFNDIKEFLSTVGLPPDHVPSTKELSQHGRQDLANIVRRRGYKFMKELLATSTEAPTNGCSSKENLIGGEQILNDYQCVSAGQNEEMKDLSSSISLSIEATKVKDQEIELVEDDPMSSDASKVEVTETAYVGDDSLSLGAAEANVLEGNINFSKTNTKLPSDNYIRSGLESSVHPSLQEKAAKFIQDGELENIGENDLVAYGAEVLNGYIASSSHQVEDRVFEMNPSRFESLSTEEVRMGNCNEDPEVEAQKMENQKEINHLKFILHQKELELTQLKERIENEKLALSMFQIKAEKEVSEAQNLISEKDAELQATEESLSGLEEVEIQFWSEGEVVEVAGSFNGWHQKIKMESEPPSSISVTSGSQKSRLWKSLLWLYPGVYQIKFIVDGHWTVDPHRESITRGFAHNNILRVGRG